PVRGARARSQPVRATRRRHEHEIEAARAAAALYCETGASTSVNARRMPEGQDRAVAVRYSKAVAVARLSAIRRRNASCHYTIDGPFQEAPFGRPAGRTEAHDATANGDAHLEGRRRRPPASQ